MASLLEYRSVVFTEAVFSFSSIGAEAIHSAVMNILNKTLAAALTGLLRVAEE